MNCQFYVGKNVELHKLVKDKLKKSGKKADFNFSEYPWIAVCGDQCSGNRFARQDIQIITVSQFLERTDIESCQFYVGSNSQLRSLVIEKLKSLNAKAVQPYDDLRYYWVVLFNTSYGLKYNFYPELVSNFKIITAAEALDL